MCTLRKAREAIYVAHSAVQDAIEQHGLLFGLEDASNMLQDAASQISGEIANQLPERPIYERRP